MVKEAAVAGTALRLGKPRKQLQRELRGDELCSCLVRQLRYNQQRSRSLLLRVQSVNNNFAMDEELNCNVDVFVV